MATYWENSCSFGLRYVSWYKCLIVSLFFSHLGFWSGNLFLIAPFPDLCLLVPFWSGDLFMIAPSPDLCLHVFFTHDVHISQLVRFARVCNHAADFNVRNKCLTAKLLQQGYRYHKLRNSFSNFGFPNSMLG